MLWSETKFSQLFIKEMYGDQSRECLCGSWGIKGEDRDIVPFPMISLIKRVDCN